VSFNGKVAIRKVVAGTYLKATVPSDATTGFVTATTSEGTLKSNKIFRVIPQVTSFSPTSGPVGTSVTITGESLAGATSVTFDGVEAKFTVDSYTRITATVPKGAKTGKIEVTTAGGTATTVGAFTVN
jgi:large repetitive protein